MEKPDIDQFSMENVDKDTDIGICVFDDKARFLYMNQAFLKIRQGAMDEHAYQSRTVHDMFSGKLVDKCIIDSVYKKKTPITDIQTVFAPDGSVLRKQLVTIYPIFDEGGNIKNAIAYYRDLSSFQASSKEFQASASDTAEIAKAVNPVNVSDHGSPSSSIVHNSQVMQKLYASAKDVAILDSTVLITGETGTGKEVLARYIHNHSARACKEMVVVDCAALPDSLMESELFGYEKGSFTGANISKMGLIENANGSTLFLDEVNSLPLSLQGKLLRTLETKSVKRLGALKPKPVDFRLIVATNADLYQCVQDKTFRSDLYYRMNVLPFNLPPLRERKEDIIPMVKYFEHYFSQKYHVQRSFSEKTYQALVECSWEGNVRELRNFVERLVIMGEDMTQVSAGSPFSHGQITKPAAVVSVTPASDDSPAPRLEQLDKEALEKQRILEALQSNGFHREKTAGALQISRRTLQYKLKKYNLL